MIYGSDLILDDFFIVVLGVLAVEDGSFESGIARLTALHKIDIRNSADVSWPTILTGLLVNHLFYKPCNLFSVR
ncbi:hypothetical protein [Bacillus halotolerans]|uniref:hypothetical protein n=1 Tax=Bacillus halotolerans TaxID=260554 RepID=UPI0007509B2E|nr:hypothetical protein [Bacillus halotolerans]KUP42270.1 hypothetical protein AU384_04855 [Bacillus halotolerans]MBT9250127.1 hypothetical protein [Bacillus halotolerans]